MGPPRAQLKTIWQFAHYPSLAVRGKGARMEGLKFAAFRASVWTIQLRAMERAWLRN
jgi:hypothetical protein